VYWLTNQCESCISLCHPKTHQKHKKATGRQCVLFMGRYRGPSRSRRLTEKHRTHQNTEATVGWYGEVKAHGWCVFSAHKDTTQFRITTHTTKLGSGRHFVLVHVGSSISRVTEGNRGLLLWGEERWTTGNPIGSFRWQTISRKTMACVCVCGDRRVKQNGSKLHRVKKSSKQS